MKTVFDNNEVFCNAYKELAEIWDKYPNLKEEYIKECHSNEYVDDNIDEFIFNSYSEIWDEMEEVFIRYYGDNYDISKDETIAFYYKYFGFYYGEYIDDL